MKKLSFITLLLFTISACSSYKKISEPFSPADALVKVGWFKRPSFYDDFDKESLLKAIANSKTFLETLPEDKEISIGRDNYTVLDLKESYQKFISILNNSSSSSEFNNQITEHFDIYQSIGRDSKSNVLFTGYYEPVLKGAKEKSDSYSFPIYGRPEDLIEIKLGDFNDEFAGRRIIARIDNNEVKPYFDRKLIETQGVLSGRNLEIAWLSSPIDIFFLHVQGSGIIEFEDGSSINVNYAAANGRPYKSIGRLLIDTEKISKEKMSMKAIREYLEKNPDEIDPILNHNESYVFFRTVEMGPIGSTGVILTGGRSIASDGNLFPKGGLGFIETEIPVTDNEGNILEWKKMSRFVIDQDKGGAIKGPARIDIFFGTGDYAGRSAGAMNRNGKLFYLVKKKN